MWFEGVDSCKSKSEGDTFQCMQHDLAHIYLTNARLKTQLKQRRLSVRYAPNAAPSQNLGKAVVVVVAVPGSKAAEVLVTRYSGTRGMRVCMPAKDGHGPGQLSAGRDTVRN